MIKTALLFLAMQASGTSFDVQILKVNGSTIAVVNAQGQVLNVNCASGCSASSSSGGSLTVTPGTGTWSVNGSTLAVVNAAGTSLSVTGPLTDTQLRASAVPVSGSFSANGSTVAVTGLNGAAVPVSGTFWQTTQPVSGGVTINGSTSAVSILAGTADIGNVIVNKSTLAVVNASGGSLSVTFPSAQSVSVSNTPTVTANAGTGPFPVNGSTVAVVNASGGSLAVTGTFWQATQPATVNGSTVAVVNANGGSLSVAESGTWTVQPGNTPNTTPWLATVNGSTVAVTNVSGANLNVAGPTLTKGSQGSTGFSTQDLKDAGRVNLTWTANAVASTATAEGLFTMQRSNDLGATTASVAYTITSGKRLRLNQLFAAIETGGTAPKNSRLRFRIRAAAGGSCSASSPLQEFVVASTSGTVATVGQAIKNYIDGMEILGDGTKQICFTVETPEWVTTTNVPLIDVDINGFEY